MGDAEQPPSANTPPAVAVAAYCGTLPLWHRASMLLSVGLFSCWFLGLTGVAARVMYVYGIQGNNTMACIVTAAAGAFWWWLLLGGVRHVQNTVGRFSYDGRVLRVRTLTSWQDQVVQ